MITIRVYGRPAPQGSKRNVGRGVMVESSKYVKPWREDVRTAAIDAIDDQRYGGGGDDTWTPLDGPLVARMVFTVAKPVTAPKRRITWPSKMPDLDKLVRSTCDALTSAGVYVDDARIVELTAAKRYPGEGVDAMDRPGALIVVRQLVPAVA